MQWNLYLCIPTTLGNGSPSQICNSFNKLKHHFFIWYIKVSLPYRESFQTTETNILNSFSFSKLNLILSWDTDLCLISQFNAIASTGSCLILLMKHLLMKKQEHTIMHKINRLNVAVTINPMAKISGFYFNITHSITTIQNKTLLF